MSLASCHLNEMSLDVIKVKMRCFTKTWVSVTLSTWVSALLSLSFLGTKLTFLLTRLFLGVEGSSSGKCRFYPKHLAPWDQLKMLQAGQKYNLAWISEVTLNPLTSYTGCEHSINLPPWSGMPLFWSIYCFPSHSSSCQGTLYTCYGHEPVVVFSHCSHVHNICLVHCKVNFLFFFSFNQWRCRYWSW